MKVLVVNTHKIDIYLQTLLTAWW